MKLRIAILLAGIFGAAVAFAQHEVELEPANNNVANTASLQRGARNFVNYCLGCHSAKYVRYNRLGADLQLTEDQLLDNLMFTGERPFDTMSIAMSPEDAARWFGRTATSAKPSTAGFPAKVTRRIRFGRTCSRGGTCATRRTSCSCTSRR